jgi:AraC-like DNA-binding protein
VWIAAVAGDSPLGTWRYGEWRPPGPAGAVELLWEFEGPTTSVRKRIFPNGCLELILNLGDSYRLVSGAGPTRLGTGWLGGLLSAPVVVDQPVRQRVVGIRLRPGGAYAVLGRPLHELAGLHVDLGDLIGDDADRMLEACHAAGSTAARFRRLALWVDARLQAGRRVDRAIGWCAARIDETAGGVPIARLRERTGWSKSRLAAAFREQIGLAPKLYARVVRFRHVLASLQLGAGPLGEVALAAGYYDQAHMNAEFRALAGTTPGAFLEARHPVGDGTTAADPLPPAAAERARPAA